MAYRVINFEFLKEDHLESIKSKYNLSIDFERIRTLTSIFVLKDFVRDLCSKIEDE